jgi:hypothetical protein
MNGLTKRQSASLEKTPSVSSEPVIAEDAGRLPCNLCLVKVSPLKVDSWLAQLEETAGSGDLQRLHDQIKGLRGQLRGDVSVQTAANLFEEES